MLANTDILRRSSTKNTLILSFQPVTRSGGKSLVHCYRIRQRCLLLRFPELIAEFNNRCGIQQLLSNFAFSRIGLVLCNDGRLERRDTEYVREKSEKETRIQVMHLVELGWSVCHRRQSVISTRDTKSLFLPGY